MHPDHCAATTTSRSGSEALARYFEARSTLPETPDALDQRGASVRAGAVALDTVWREAHDRALAALEVPGIVVVLGPADVGGTFLHELMAGLRERGRAVTFVPRADLARWWPADSALVIEDAAQMDAVRLEAICRPPGRRIVLAGLPACALAELPAPLTPAPLTVVTLEPPSPDTAAPPATSMSNARVAIESGVLDSALAKLPALLAPAPLSVVPLEPLSPGTAAAPRTSARSNARAAVASVVLAFVGVFGARMAIASGVLAAISVAGALLTRAPSTPQEPAPSALEPGAATSAASSADAGQRRGSSRYWHSARTPCRSGGCSDRASIRQRAGTIPAASGALARAGQPSGAERAARGGPRNAAAGRSPSGHAARAGGPVRKRAPFAPRERAGPRAGQLRAP